MKNIFSIFLFFLLFYSKANAQIETVIYQGVITDIPIQVEVKWKNSISEEGTAILTILQNQEVSFYTARRYFYDKGIEKYWRVYLEENANSSKSSFSLKDVSKELNQSPFQSLLGVARRSNDYNVQFQVALFRK